MHTISTYLREFLLKYDKIGKAGVLRLLYVGMFDSRELAAGTTLSARIFDILVFGCTYVHTLILTYIHLLNQVENLYTKTILNYLFLDMYI